MTTQTQDTMNTIIRPSHRWDHYHQERAPEVGSPLWNHAQRAAAPMAKARTRGPKHEIMVAKRYMSNNRNAIHAIGGCRRSQRGEAIVLVSVDALRLAMKRGERVCADCLR